MRVTVRAPRRPRLAHEFVVHAREISVPLTQFAAQQRHPLDHPGIHQPACIHKSERHRLHDVQEGLLGGMVVPDDEDIAHGSIECRRIEDFPPDVLEGADDLALRKLALELFRAAGVPWQDEIRVVVVEGIRNIDEYFSGIAGRTNSARTASSYVLGTIPKTLSPSAIRSARRGSREPSSTRVPALAKASANRTPIRPVPRIPTVVMMTSV